MVFGIGVLVTMSCLLAGISWRLAQGPIDLGWLVDRVGSTLIDATLADNVSFDQLSLAWEGFHKGADHPLDLRVSNISIADSAGRRLVTAPTAHVTLSLRDLLLGRLVARSLEVDHGRVLITREVAGQANLDSGSFDLRSLWEQLAHSVPTDRLPGHGVVDQVRRVHFRDAALTFRDPGSGLAIQASGVDLDLLRAASGRIHGSLDGQLTLGGERASVAGDIDLSPRGAGGLSLRLTSFRPAAIEPLPPDLAFLSDFEMPVSAAVSVAFDAAPSLTHVGGSLRFGEGQLRIRQGAIPLRGGSIEFSGTTDAIAINKGHLAFAHSAETADFSGTVAHMSDRFQASLTVGVEQIDIGDLPRLWPIGVAHDARSWVTQHVLGGVATKGSASLVIEADEALREVIVTKATGELDGADALFTWLDNMPPIEQAQIHLKLTDPDTLEIHLTSGRQSVGGHGSGLSIKDSEMRITGLAFKDQIAEIHVQVQGQMTSTQSLLSEPRLHLLSVHPIGLNPTSGEASADLDFQFPLESNLRIDDVAIHAAAQLVHVRLQGVAGGHELDDGTFELDADNSGLDLKGHGTLAAIPVTLQGRMEFDLRGPDQITQKIVITGQPQAAQIDAAGLLVTDIVHGPIPMTIVVTERRSGAGSVSINGDLTQATLEVAPLAWSKPSGTVATAAATLLMTHDRLTKIDHLSISGEEVAVEGSADFLNGRIGSVILDNIRLGRSNGRGSIHIGAGGEIEIALQGSQVDLEPKLLEERTGADVPRGEPVIAPTWKLDTHFDRAILANGESVTDLVAKATGAGTRVRDLSVIGAARAKDRFSIEIVPQAAKRHLSVEADDAGRFLRGLNAIRNLQSGHLKIDGSMVNPLGLHPLTGTMTIDHAVIRNSPILATLLQAITVYGMVDVVRGPGLTFSHIVVPFDYNGTELKVDEAYAANPSLGLTATGRVNLTSGAVSIIGTIVPAYFFNSMLGQLPIVGKLFSPESGGGVFAARFGVGGSLEDPRISINPISALTPGFLREIFGVFGHASGTP